MNGSRRDEHRKGPSVPYLDFWQVSLPNPSSVLDPLDGRKHMGGVGLITATASQR